MNGKLFFALFSCAALSISAGPAHAQGLSKDSKSAYPARTIHLVIPFAPAGPADMVGRAIGQKLTEAWGQQVVIENRGGAGGNIGTGYVAKAAPDGHTLLLANLGVLAINPAVYKDVPFDSVASFDPITLVAGTPLVLVTHPSIPVKTLKQLIAFANGRPGQLNFASAGTGGPTHLAGELFKKEARIDIVHVPYKGNVTALTALAGGETHMMFTNLITPVPFIKSGRMVAIAVTSAKRQPALPQVPTMDEAGLKGFEVSGWYGILAPKGTPRDIVSKLNAEIVGILRLPEIDQQFVRQGIEIFTSTPSQFAEKIKTELPRWRKVVTDARVTPF